MNDSGKTVYDEFYAEGGWKYSLFREWLWHRRHVVKPFGLKRGMKLLEPACGMGFHTNMFRLMGFKSTGFDICQTAIEIARKNHPKSKYYLCNVNKPLPFNKNSFDVILSRGCSRYHYDVTSDSAWKTTNNLMEYLAPGGVFIIAIISDLSGRIAPDGVWNNKLEAYSQLLSHWDKNCIINWHKGMVIAGARKPRIPKAIPQNKPESGTLPPMPESPVMT